MFKFNNTHIFTGYLKQLLSSFNLPMCKVYTKEFAEYFDKHGKEDPRVIESFDNVEYIYNKDTLASKKHAATRVNYLKGNEVYNYFTACNKSKTELNFNNVFWRRAADIFYTPDKSIPGLTKLLNSPGSLYDSDTHEYLGDYLRFIRDYYNINLMSLYNCFNNKICSNLYYRHKIQTTNQDFDESQEESTENSRHKETYRVFDAKDSKYRIYAIPVKLFSNYIIAVDCSYEIEMFCGFYKTTLDTTEKAKDLINKTYKKINRTFFNQPFLYDKLNVSYWNFDSDCLIQEGNEYPNFLNEKIITRWDIINKEQDLKLFIKIPASCSSSIVILEGDYRNYNDFKYYPICLNPDGSVFNENTDDATKARTIWKYEQNHSVINFDDKAGIENSTFKPISKIQLLAFNTGESYPFADRLVEYLTGSTITSAETIPDNIKRVQKVMSQNQHYFKIEGIWEDKMQKIIYDYMMNSGPIETVKASDGKIELIDNRRGYHPRLGYTSKSSLYDTLGYVDKEAEKWYASWTKENGKAKVLDTIQNVDIYNGLYDI